MLDLRKPGWMIALNTLPVMLIFYIFWGEYNMIQSLLEEENKALWFDFGIALGIIAFLILSYVFILMILKKDTDIFISLFCIFSTVPFLYLYFYFINDLVPREIPNWMIPDEILFYTFTLLLPGLAYSLYNLVIILTPKPEEEDTTYHFIYAFFIPIGWYVFFQLIIPLWRPLVDPLMGTHMVVIFFAISTIAFFFFLARWIYLLLNQRFGIFSTKYELFWKIPFCILFPLLGLLLNQGLIYKENGVPAGFFGNFSNPWFYILAALNGISLCLPNYNHSRLRLFLYFSRCITFAYTLYFFIVFLPFLPFSILLIVVFFLGFLILSPTVLILVHLNQLSLDIEFLKQHFSKTFLLMSGIVGFLLLPMLIHFNYLQSRNVLYTALDYLYKPDYAEESTISSKDLAYTMQLLKENKKRQRWVESNTQTPYLSSYYNWLVLNNLTISDEKIKLVEKVFFGRDFKFRKPMQNLNSEGVKVTKTSSQSQYDPQQKAWISTIELEISNQTESPLMEYITRFALPTGCWISDYYLYIEGRKEKGILAEKKSAMWVFSEIRNVRRDPGILYYVGNDLIEWRIFPFQPKEIRTTGIEFIHKEPLEIWIDGNKIQLGDTTKIGKEESIHKNKFVHYVSAKEKEKLKSVKRKPYFHFIVDISEGYEERKERFVKRIEQCVRQKGVDLKTAKITFCNSFIQTSTMEENWKEKLLDQNLEGGFFLDRALRKIMFDSYQSKGDYFPIPVLVTDALDEAIMLGDFQDFDFFFTEYPYFWHLLHNGAIEIHSLKNNPLEICKNPPGEINPYVLAYPNEQQPIAFLPDNKKASIVLVENVFEVPDSMMQEKNWESGLLMQGKWMAQVLNPKSSEAEWLKLVRFSFLTGIMSPVTSYISLENEAQKAALKRKQEQVLASGKVLDTGEEVRRMSEPEFLLIFFLLILFLLFQKRKHIFQYFSS